MTYSKRECAKDLKAQLDLGYEPKQIGNWAHKMYLYCGHPKSVNLGWPQYKR